MDSNKKLGISISANRDSIKVGDRIMFKISLKNLGSVPFYLLPWGDPYTTGWVKAKKDGQYVGEANTVEYDLKLYAEKKDFIRLKPNEEYTLEKEGRLEEGLRLDFGDSKLLLKERGKFMFHAGYSNLFDSYYEGGSKKKIDAWVGKIESKGIEVSIG
jgi:hypothetical protein